MNDRQEFHIGDILSVVFGFLLSPEHITGLGKLMKFMTGESPFTHQVPRFMDECRGYLFEQHPWLHEISKDDLQQKIHVYQQFVDRGEHELFLRSVLKDFIDRYGEYHAIHPIHFEDHLQIDPIEELRQMAPHAQIIGIISDTSEEESSDDN